MTNIELKKIYGVANDLQNGKKVECNMLENNLTFTKKEFKNDKYTITFIRQNVFITSKNYNDNFILIDTRNCKTKN